MAHMVVRHKVRDFDDWKVSFDLHGPTRIANGCSTGSLFRSTADPNEVFVMLECDSHEKAHKFAESECLRNVMNRAGVIGKPDVYFVDEVEKFGR